VQAEAAERRKASKHVPYVSVDRPGGEDISDEQRALILEHNQLDAELYELALELFDSGIADR
jgi:hypothetical protein